MDRIVSSPESTKLSHEIAEKAITLVRHEASVLPLDRSKKIAVLGISNGFDGPGTMAPFAGALRSGGLRFSQSYLQENSLQQQTDAARKAVNEADTVIVGLYGRVRSGAANSVGIPENGAAILREALASGKKVVGIAFGNPYILSSFPEMKTYVVAYGDMPSLQRAAARGLLGQQQFTGKLPISLPGLHPRGFNASLNLPKPIALPKPNFPPAALAVRARSDVTVNVLIDESGMVSDATAISGHPLLRQAAVNAAKGSTFQIDDRSGSKTLTIIYRFADEGTADSPCCEGFPYLVTITAPDIRIAQGGTP
ncbi:glycoside hydrolase family 3 C-terminal domain-containing protein [Leptolyngbya sp. 7M]|uniref:glycoside hydrolase family 3 C-terminal domain-containing protein n=1 Tax=Leptolyngbya sp. 7M TaxID=2812896 RepID=UPI0028F43526|nr:glycoside hydrolase family 3 C-terminal domain-containing protein [Leptolyngbya sp. 7M]